MKKVHWSEGSDPACGTPHKVACATDYDEVTCKRCLALRKTDFDPWNILAEAGHWLGEGLVGLLGKLEGEEEKTSKPKKRKRRKMKK